MLRCMTRLVPKRTSRAIQQLAPLTTYSGGQPSEGQGGFYGALRSRSEKSKFEPGCRAEPADVDALEQVMAQFREQQDEAKAWHQVTQSEQVPQLVQKLYVKGSPVWGLSKAQRDFVSQLKAKLQSA